MPYNFVQLQSTETIQITSDMCEEVTISNLKKHLEILEGDSSHKQKVKCYAIFQNALNEVENGVDVVSDMVNRLVQVCLHDLKDQSNAFMALTILNAILRNIDVKKEMVPKLLNCLLETLNVIKTTTLLDKVQALQKLCFETIILYPDSVFIELGKYYSEVVIELLNLNLDQKQVFSLILKLFKSLPNETKKHFVEKNLDLWFTKLIPAVINSVHHDTTFLPISFEVLEALTDVLVDIDYTNNTNWQHILECICNPAMYPSIMKNMLLNANEDWYRLWIVCIKLLKNQITRSNIQYGSPINSMLPVVETAFKMEAASRCRAFKCWDVLIDNFQMETSEANIVKRLKLLIIPLLSNNAKIEETTLAKFYTWWHLICKFENKLEKFLDTVLFSFLHFCFGKPSSQKQCQIPGLLTINTKKRCVEAFTEIAGHLDCGGCVNLERLNFRVLTKKVLVDHWTDWVHSLKTAISITCENTGGEYSTQNIVCVWKSFVFTVSELPDNSIRRDLFDELLILLETLLKQSGPDNKYAEVIFNLLMSLFRDKKNYALLKEDPLHKITIMLMTPAFDLYFKRNDIQDTIVRMKPLAEYVINCNSERFIKSFFKESLLQINSLVLLWSALTEVIVGSKCDSIKNLQLLLVNPLKSNLFFTQDYVKYSSLLWYKLFEIVYPKAVESIDKNLNDFVWSKNTVCVNLKLFAAIGILNYDLEKQGSDIDKHIELLLTLTSNIDDYTVLDNVWTPIVNVLERAMKKILMMIKIKLAKNWMGISNNILKLINMAIQHGVKKEAYINNLHNILLCLDTFLQRKNLSALIAIIFDELVDLSLLIKEKTVRNKILTILKTCLPNIMDPCLNKRIVNDINKMECVDSVDIHTSNNTGIDKFTTPNSKAITRRAKKREAAVVSTVVDNGEEFIVVKSNWRFNPRKLTENQKEKLQRKREDIPALYQDLSQSQDEFKLTSWKPESQDSSSTNSTTASHSTTVNKMSNGEEVSNILKNVPSPNIVPKIINNILTENAKVSCSDKDLKSDSNISITSPDVSKQTVNVKDVKSPRIALKDRVFRNVRNLIEKSNTHKENDFSDSLNVDDISKTPISKSDNIPNMANSAPPKISTERPSRVKRKPRKFDDSELFLLKKSRHPMSQSDSQHETNMNPNDVLENKMESESSAIIDLNDEKCVKLPNKTTNTEVNVEIHNEQSSKLVTEDKQITVEINAIIDESHLREVQASWKPVDLEKSEQKHVLVNDDTADNDRTPNLIEIAKEDKSSISVNREDDIKSTKKHVAPNQNTPVKKNKQNSSQRSRIEKELAIDTVEGHPLLKTQSGKRVTRKNITSLNNSRRKSLTEKLNKSKLEVKHNKTLTPYSKKKDKDKTSNEITVCDDNCEKQFQISHDLSEDMPLSEDIIESSQDSTLTTISVTSTKNTLKKLTVLVEKVSPKGSETQASNLNTESNKEPNINKRSINPEGQDDTELPINKSVVIDKSEFDLTENMDTEPLISEIVDNSNDVIVINDDEDSTSASSVGIESQEIADADTQPTDFIEKLDIIDKKVLTTISVEDIGLETQEIANADTLQNDLSEEILPATALQTLKDNTSILINADHNVPNSRMIVDIATPVDNTEHDFPKTISESLDVRRSKCETDSSPLKDEEQRKRDFMDNTIEISPIKIMSPVKEKNSLSPETSSDYVVIKLSSPVQSNGEPFEKCDSPEIFTEEKISPDKRDVSPPREGNTASNNNSPSSSLSLKKNRPQVRPGGRAAQMLGLCVPDRIHTISTVERSEPEEPKRSNLSSTITPARRNLRIFYNSVADSENCEDKDDSENFLKFKKTLPNADSSPSVPILKRKLAEITDDTALSPASKRKRVSFHDPPVSTTISVQKYIEPCGVRSPQNSAAKRLGRENLRSQQSTLKSPKRLENVFKLDSVLTKTVESFTEIDMITSDDTQSMSLDETPAVEIVKTSDLNDTDPICPDLLDCNDQIDEIAADLSSPTMKVMFLKEIKGKINTVGDLAKMTELEVNRLCIKAPKVKVAKKVLNDYASKISVPVKQLESEQVVVQETNNTSTTELFKSDNIDIETQTEDVIMKDIEVQTIPKIMKIVDVQTDKMELSTISVQTEESGSKTTKEIITSCLSERRDFVEVLAGDLEESSKVKIAEKLPFNTLNDILVKNLTDDNSRIILTKILEKQNEANEGNMELRFLQDYLCDRFNSRDLIMFCSRLLAKIHDNPS